jgi:O-antigen/teichoic acid export membrane protein
MAALALAIVATPIISRLFDPADFGVAALFIAATAVIATMMSLAYERAVLYPRDESTAAKVLLVALATSLGFTTLMYALLVLFTLLWPEFVASSGIGVLIWLFPIAAFLTSLRSTFVPLCMRREDFSSIAIADVTDVATLASTRIVWGLLLSSSVAGLLFGHFLGLVVAAFICGYRSREWFRDAAEPVSAPAGVCL